MKLKIDSMSCGSCVKHIEQALKSRDKDIKLKFDLKLKTLESDSELDSSEILKILEEEGYSSIIVTNEMK